MQTIRYEVMVEVTDEPLLDESDQRHLERMLKAAVVSRGWGVAVSVERER